MEKIKPYWEKIKAALGKISKKVYVLALIILVIAAAAITFALNNRPYAPLFTGLSSEEATSIMAYLDEQGLKDYRLENSDTIMVPRDQENMLKAKLMMAGYPKSGFGYSTYYDHVSALSTEAERNRAYLNDVQDRMAATIRCLEGVKDATVTITQGEDRGYVLDSNNVINATAGVMVTMRDGQKISSQMAKAIRNFVSHSVQGLEVSSVSIIDSLGNSYSGTDDGMDGEASQLKLQLEEEYNNRIRTEVMNALAPIFGQDNIRVGVSSTVDVDRITSDATNVFLPEWAQDGSTNGEGIVGSKQWDDDVTHNGNETTGGVPGTTTNSDLPTYVENLQTPNGNETDIHTSGQVDYDNSREETHTERPPGYLTDCMVSVSINGTTAGDVDVPAIREHVARAAGIKNEVAAEKISILSYAFYTDPILPPIGPGETIPMWVVLAAAGGLLLFLVLLTVILLIRKKRRKKKKAEEEAAMQPQYIYVEAGAQEPVPADGPPMEASGANVMSLKTERSMELRQGIRKFADDNPEIAAQMVKSLLRGGEEDG